jgi:hypothetical protein
MLENDAYVRQVIQKWNRATSEAFRLSAAVGRVAVLLLLVSRYNTDTIQAEEAPPSSLCLFSFSCEFGLGVGHGRLDGLMASNGVQHRIALYWIEPDVFREGTSYVRYTDFIFSSEKVCYWLYPGVERGIIHLPVDGAAGLASHSDSPESIVVAALNGVVSFIPSQHGDAPTPTELGQFLEVSREQATCTSRASPGEVDAENLSTLFEADTCDSNSLSATRQYSKELRADGVLLWRAETTGFVKPVAIVAVKPAVALEPNACSGVFDVNTLGQWQLIPESYRRYWVFDLTYSKLEDSENGRATSCALYDAIAAYSGDKALPNDLNRAIQRLGWRTALRTDDWDRVQRSVVAAIDGLCRGTTLGDYRLLLELARVSGAIQKQYPGDSQEWLRPSIGQVVRLVGPDISQYLGRLMQTIHANRWFVIATLLFDEIRIQGLMEDDALTQAAAQFNAMRLAEEIRPPDPCEPYACVREYLAHLDEEPARGDMGLADLRHMLEKGLERRYGNDDSQTKVLNADRIVQLVRLLVGDGPFRGEQREIEESIPRFVERCRIIHSDSESIDAVLATFLALSFCDISTTEDHSVFLSQIERVSVSIQTQINTALAERGLTSLMPPEDAETSFRKREQYIRTYVDDPLWPLFKFPLTTNEEMRLINKLKLQVMRAYPAFDQVALEVKYAGISEELRKRVARDVAHIAEQLLFEAACLRRPSYPGVSCHYRSRLGFTAMIEEPFYKESKRPRDVFKAMKYFHMGHRLEDVVLRERELANTIPAQEVSQ